jgi:hypothetical protein
MKFILNKDNLEEYKIESNIPIPPPIKVENTSKYPINKMKVGDSFLVPFDTKDMDKKRKMRNSLTSVFSRKKPKKFTVRMTEKGIRVWRIE